MLNDFHKKSLLALHSTEGTEEGKGFSNSSERIIPHAGNKNPIWGTIPYIGNGNPKWEPFHHAGDENPKWETIPLTGYGFFGYGYQMKNLFRTIALLIICAILVTSCIFPEPDHDHLTSLRKKSSGSIAQIKEHSRQLHGHLTGRASLLVMRLVRDWVSGTPVTSRSYLPFMTLPE